LIPRRHSPDFYSGDPNLFFQRAFSMFSSPARSSSSTRHALSRASLPPSTSPSARRASSCSRPAAHPSPTRSSPLSSSPAAPCFFLSSSPRPWPSLALRPPAARHGGHRMRSSWPRLSAALAPGRRRRVPCALLCSASCLPRMPHSVAMACPGSSSPARASSLVMLLLQLGPCSSPCSPWTFLRARSSAPARS
jgi:hypothetical protein